MTPTIKALIEDAARRNPDVRVWRSQFVLNAASTVEEALDEMEREGFLLRMTEVWCGNVPSHLMWSGPLDRFNTRRVCERCRVDGDLGEREYLTYYQVSPAWHEQIKGKPQ